MIRRSVRFGSPVAGRGAIAVALLLGASAAGAGEGTVAPSPAPAPAVAATVIPGSPTESTVAAPGSDERADAPASPQAPASSDPSAGIAPAAAGGPVAVPSDPTQTGSASLDPAQPGSSQSQSESGSGSGSASSDPAPITASQRAEPLRLEPARTSLLPLAQPLWTDLTTSQRQVLAPFEGQWNALPLTEKRAWADLARRFPQLKTDEQARVQKRIAEWARLTPEQRRVARNNYRLAQQVARENVLAEWERYQAMTPEQRNVLNAAGSTSNTAARHVAAPNGLAKVAAQPLPRSAPRPPATLTVGTDGGGKPAAGVAPTVGPAPRNGAGPAR